MSYTPNSGRMFKNTAILYFRMALMMCISLYTSRVVLQTLGVEDFGIYDVVGGVVILFSFINDGMTVSTLRFLTFELGKDNRQKLNEIFVTSINIHLIISAVIVLLSETVGLWFMMEKMVIPQERMTAAMWCYQISIFTAVVNIMSYPYNAAIIAHEKMSAFAYISILDAILKLLLVYLLLAFSYDRLILYAILFACEKMLLRFVYNLYCTRHFDECHYHWVFKKSLFSEMLAFAGWNMWGNLAYVVSAQGLNMLLNIFFGPIANASRSIAVQVQSAVNQFARNFQMAINPQITKTYATGQMGSTHQLIYRSSRFTFCLLLILCLPLIVETPAILGLWLIEVPEHSVSFVRLLLITLFIQENGNPIATTVAATGQIRRCEFIIGTLMLVIVPIAYLVLKMGGRPWTVYFVHLCIAIVVFFVRIRIVMPLINLKIGEYIHHVWKKCGILLLLSVAVPIIMKLLPYNGVVFSILNIILTVSATVVLSFFIGLDSMERKMIMSKVMRKKNIDDSK